MRREARIFARKQPTTIPPSTTTVILILLMVIYSSINSAKMMENPSQGAKGIPAVFHCCLGSKVRLAFRGPFRLRTENHAAALRVSSD